MYSVSEAIFTCLCSGIESMVCILCRRSAILMMITRISSFSVKSIFRKFSACKETSVSFFRLEILVNPCTIFATVLPKRRSISSKVYSVSSTVSWSNAAAIQVASNPISDATIFATAMGWNMYASPDFLLWSLWASTAVSKAKRISFLSSSLS